MPRKFSNEQCEGELSRVLNHVETIQSKKRADHSGIGAITLLPTAYTQKKTQKKKKKKKISILKRVTKGYHFFQKEKKNLRLEDLQTSNLSTM